MTTETAAKPGDQGAFAIWPAILIATLVGGIARAAPVFAAGFPINDGGLFASFVDAILAGPQLLPDSITYNGLNAPFAYPPLAFLATAGLEHLVPIGTVEWLRWIPLISSIATIPAFGLLAIEMAPTRVHAAVATFAFALVPRSFEWLVMGGGLARAPGMLLAIVAIYLVMRFLKRGDRSWIGSGIALGLAVLTHPDAGVFAAISLVLVSLAYARGREAWSRVVAAAAVGVLVTAPWMVAVITRHGIAPLVSAGGVSTNLPESLFLVLTARLTDEPFWMLTAGLAVLGFVYSLSRRRYIVPAWSLVMIVADPRASGTYVSVQLALLAAIGLLDVVVARLARVDGDVPAVPGWHTRLLRSRGVSLVLGGSLVLAMLSAFLAPFVLSPMASLDADSRSAMSWVRNSLPDSARVVVVTGRPWYEDSASEWFPYLAGRQSIATVQGFEWMGASAWQGQNAMFGALQDRATETVASLDEWAVTYRAEYDYVYIPKSPPEGPTAGRDCCTALRQTLRASGAYEIVYDGPGATIARRRASA